MKKLTRTNPTVKTKAMYARKIESRTISKIDSLSKKTGLSKTYIVNKLLKKALTEKDPLGVTN